MTWSFLHYFLLILAIILLAVILIFGLIYYSTPDDDKVAHYLNLKIGYLKFKIPPISDEISDTVSDNLSNPPPELEIPLDSDASSSNATCSDAEESTLLKFCNTILLDSFPSLVLPFLSDKKGEEAEALSVNVKSVLTEALQQYHLNQQSISLINLKKCLVLWNTRATTSPYIYYFVGVGEESFDMLDNKAFLKRLAKQSRFNKDSEAHNKLLHIFIPFARTVPQALSFILMETSKLSFQEQSLLVTEKRKLLTLITQTISLRNPTSCSDPPFGKCAGKDLVMGVLEIVLVALLSLYRLKEDVGILKFILLEGNRTDE